MTSVGSLCSYEHHSTIIYRDDKISKLCPMSVFPEVTDIYLCIGDTNSNVQGVNNYQVNQKVILLLIGNLYISAYGKTIAMFRV